jgi:hypothetical protein
MMKTPKEEIKQMVQAAEKYKTEDKSAPCAADKMNTLELYGYSWPMTSWLASSVLLAEQ